MFLLCISQISFPLPNYGAIQFALTQGQLLMILELNVAPYFQIKVNVYPWQDSE